ncbi:MAG: hypothetical protein M3R08_07590 [Bacteroidota bacterium]|nr:hypothetical protein [Bacteroidota bacterium]
MRTLQPIAFVGLLLTMVLASCSVEKRVHQPGYHVEWHTAQKSVKPLPQTAIAAPAATVDAPEAAELPVMESAMEVETPVLMEKAETTVSASKGSVEQTETAQPSALKSIANEQEKKSMTTFFPTTVPTDGLDFGREKGTKGLKASLLKKQFSKPSGDEGKWLRWWLILWGVGLILIILAVVLVSPAIYIVGALAWLAGTVFGVIWLVNKLS